MPDRGTGEVTAPIGRSGSGISTLQRSVDGVVTIQSGRIEIGGHVVSTDKAALCQLRRDVGIVYQSYSLYSHPSVGANTMLVPPIVKHVAWVETRCIAGEVVALIGLSEKFDAYPDELLGDQPQRVAIARLLTMMRWARRVASTTVFMHQGMIHKAGPSKTLCKRPATP